MPLSPSNSPSRRSILLWYLVAALLVGCSVAGGVRARSGVVDASARIKNSGTLQQSANEAVPLLFTQENSTRAIALESVTLKEEPFALTSPLAIGPDNRTRIMLFALNVN